MPGSIASGVHPRSLRDGLTCGARFSPLYKSRRKHHPGRGTDKNELPSRHGIEVGPHHQSIDTSWQVEARYSRVQATLCWKSWHTTIS